MAIGFDTSAVFSLRIALLAPIITFALTIAFFGFYTLLFGLACYFLFTGEHLAHRKLHIGWIISLFILSTLGGLITASSGLDDLAIQYTALLTQNPIPFVKAVTHYEKETVMRISILMSRGRKCSRRLRNYPSNLSSLGIKALGNRAPCFRGDSNKFRRSRGSHYENQGFSNSANPSNFAVEVEGENILVGFYYTNAVVNMLLTLTIAGRIWWVGVRTSRSFGHDGAIHKKYKQIIVVLLECGIIYPIALFAHAAVSSNEDSIVPVNMTGVVIQVAGIAPTLIILCTCLGRTASQKVIESQRSTYATSSGPYSSRRTGISKNLSTLVQASQSNSAVISTHNIEVEIEMKRVTEEV
ncbi:hypothetical protein D9757_012478 [Collybiopsis confluens]|uniref:Uncharacterized protein n=1 Tax=Collybiopsis confluens TaxID=2823264 RepID=A0A8H5LGH4_9AGAR|nr:hypothetical protein D9757_012478 [Collybiopsis confluens]